MITPALDSPSARYHRSKFYFALGRFEEARDDLTHVLRAHPNLVIAHLSRAVVLDRLGRLADALADATEACKLAPHTAPPPLVRGVVHAHRGDLGAAIDDLSAALRIGACLPLALLERSTAYLLGGDHNRALADCNQLIALAPEQPLAYLNRGIVHHHQGDTRQAAADLARALQLDPQCMLGGSSVGVAERRRSLSAQQLADYIDGLGFDGSVLQAPTPHGSTTRPRETTPRPSSVETRELPAQRSSETASIPVVTDIGIPANSATGRGRHGNAAEFASIPPAGPRNNGAAQVEPNRRPVRSTTDSPRGDEGSNPHQPAGPGASPRTERPASARSAAAIAAQASLLGQNRLPPRKPAKRRTATAEYAITFAHLKKPLPLTIAAVAGLVLLYLVFPASLFGTPDRVRVYPARGKAEFAGKPMAQATIFLNPIGEKDPKLPIPRGVVQEDGSFVLGTYAKDDGAPAGDYAVTVQWFRPNANPNREGLAAPVSLLPPRYANAKSSGLNVRIETGDNDLAVLRLTR
jgi:hypothetical protein